MRDEVIPTALNGSGLTVSWESQPYLLHRIEQRFPLGDPLSSARNAPTPQAEQVARRFVTLFAEELAAVKGARDALAEGVRVEPAALKEALEVAQELRRISDNPPPI